MNTLESATNVNEDMANKASRTLASPNFAQIEYCKETASPISL